MKIDRVLWGRALGLLDQALDLTVADRPRWLAAQPLDPTLRRALEQLLADREAIERAGFLDALPQLPLDEPPASTALGLQPGDLFGAYRLLRELGQGGMSVVWLAERDDGQLRRRVALKIPHAGPGQALLAERLRRERDILAALEHPHIARLYDVGVTPQGLPFLVLEYVEGEALNAHCDARRLPVAQRLALFLQVLGAVQHAHAMLVLHRDLKPSNILVNAAGEVKLLDFGIAKLLRGSEAESTALTREGGQVLTPHYAAPEQVAGAALGTASDVYALGVVLFELLTGERPYRLPRVSRAALEEAILRADPSVPSELWRHAGQARADRFASTPRRMRQALRGDLDLIVLTALQKRPQRRYPSADAFAQDLQRLLAHQPIAAQPDSAGYRLRKFVVRNGLAVGAAGAVVLALGVGLGIALWQARETRLEAAKATAIKDFLVGLFESNSVEQSDALRKRQQSVQDLLQQSAQALHVGLDDQPQVRDELRSVVGRLLHELQLSDAAVQLRQARVDGLASHAAAPTQRVRALHELADSLAQRGDGKTARQTLEQALALCGGSESLPCLDAQVALGLRVKRENDIRQATALIEPALRALRRLAPGSEETARALSAHGELLTAQNRLEEGYVQHREAMALRERLWGAGSIRLARARYELGMNLWSSRRMAMAESELGAALRAISTAYGPEHVATAAVELQLGRLQTLVRGEGRDRLAHAKEVLERDAARAPPEDLFDARLVFAENLLFDGRLADAGRAFDQVLAMPPPSASAADDLDRLHAQYLSMTGRYDAARERLGAFRQRMAFAHGEGHPYVAEADDRLARVHLLEGRLDEAQQLFERALKARDAREGSFGSYKHEAAAAKAALDMERGRFDQAWPVVSANHAAMQKTPRADQYLRVVSSVTDHMARALVGLRRPQQARPYFERRIEQLQSGYRHSPVLAVARARYAACLLDLHEVALARQQLALAEAALAAEPEAAPHFKRVVAATRMRLQERQQAAAP